MACRVTAWGYWNVALGQLPAYMRHDCQQAFQVSTTASKKRPRLFPGTLFEGYFIFLCRFTSLFAEDF